MRKTLLNALKHGSGTIFILLAMMLGGSLQAWGGTRSFSAGEKIYLANFNPSGWAGTWISSGGTAWIELWNNSSDHVNYEFEYVSGTEYSNRACYAATITGGGSYSNYKIYRGSAVGSSWNSTGEISFGSGDTGKNTIVDFSENGNTATWVASRSFSTGEYIYLKNIKPGGWSDNWISSTCQYAYLYMWGGTAGVHTYRFNLVSGYGDEYALNSIYGAQIQTSGTYAYFILTRGQSSCADGSFPSVYNDDKTGNVPFDATKNYIVDYTKSVTSVTWDVFNPCTEPTVTTTSSPSTTAVSASCAGTYSTGGDYCAPISGGIAYKKGSDDYSDQAGTVSAGAISASLSGLIPGTTYTYKAYIVLDNSTRIEGSEQTFTTGCPTITITGQPSESPVSYCSGAAISALSVTATSSPDYTMEYQWYSSSDKSSDSTISGATESSYTPSSGTLYYRCKVRTNSACDSSAETSNYSGQITFDPAKVSPVITVSASSVTNYTPVTLTASKAVIETWALSGSGVNQYLYKKTGTSAVFKGNVGSGSAVTYTITGTTSNDCSSAVNITVNSDVDICQ